MFYNFNCEERYKYYNPDLMRNIGEMKKDQPIHRDFPSSIDKVTLSTKRIKTRKGSVSPKNKRKRDRK